MQVGGASTRRTENIAQGAGRRIVWFDLEAQSLHFLRVSDAPEALLGIPEQLWLEPDFWPGGIHPDDRVGVAAFCAQVLDGDRPQGCDCRLTRADGATVWVHMMARRSSSEVGVINGYLMDAHHRVAEDIASDDNTMREELLAIVTERLNQQLRAISGYAEMMERHLSIQADDVGSEYALGIRTGLENLHRMLHTIRPATRRNSDDMDAARRALHLLRTDHN